MKNSENTRMYMKMYTARDDFPIPYVNDSKPFNLNSRIDFTIGEEILMYVHEDRDWIYLMKSNGTIIKCIHEAFNRLNELETKE